MGNHQAQIVIEPALWCLEAERVLGDSILRAPCFGVADYRRAWEKGAKLFRVATPGGALVGYVLLDIEHSQYGAEGVILAASGSLAGADLTAELLPVFEKYFTGVRAIRICSARPAFIKKLATLGYQASHLVFRKDLTHAPV